MSRRWAVRACAIAVFCLIAFVWQPRAVLALAFLAVLGLALLVDAILLLASAVR